MGKKSIARSLLPAVADDKFPLVQSLVHLVFSELVTKHCVAETTTKAKRRCLNENDPVIVLIAMNEFKDFNGIEEGLFDDLEGIAEACTCSQKTHRSQARQIAERWLAKAKELEEGKATKASQQPKREYAEDECEYNDDAHGADYWAIV
ncbi:hypothetical protein KC316_g5449 [Hortaea werneckii]|nr:hypothetical protein KC324_g4838 [Hortaea werneckii]KAI7586679.1 hypothetical protein KC316_g5449 [Hortaea werneckii]